MSFFSGYLGMPKWVHWGLALCTAVIASTGVAGYLLLQSELNELQRQNRLTELVLRQTYRPLGVAEATWARQGNQVLSRLTAGRVGSDIRAGDGKTAGKD